MQVSLGTVTVDDETRKSIRQKLGKKGLASRNEVKEYYLSQLQDGQSESEGEVSDGDAAATEAPAGPNDEGDNFGADLPQTTYEPGGPGEGLPDPRADRGDLV